MNKSVMVSALLGLSRKTQQLLCSCNGEEKAFFYNKDRMSSNGIQWGPQAGIREISPEITTFKLFGKN
jgi:hypothetical protein